MSANLGYIYVIQSSCYGNRLKIGSTRDINRRKWDYHTYVPDNVTYTSFFNIIDYGDFSQYKNPLLSIETSIHKYSWFKKRRTDKHKEFFIHDTDDTEYTEYTDDTEYTDNTKNKDEIFGISGIRDFIRNIEYFLDSNGVVFKPVYKDEITCRPKKDKCEYIKEISIKNDIDKEFRLRDYQEECLEKLKQNCLGKFILPTGAGKTIIFLDYLKKEGGINLILVPFIDLVNQTFQKAKCFGFSKIVKICESKRVFWGDKDSQDILYISTYQSSDKSIYSLCELEYTNIIFDETHYTVIRTENENSIFQYVLKNGKSKKRFFFTATEVNIKTSVKQNLDISEDIYDSDFDSDSESDDTVKISMDNKEIYGETLFSMPIDESVKKGILCDYNINIFLHNKNNKLLTVRNIVKNYGEKILIFCSSIKTMKNVAEYIKNECTGNSERYPVDYADGTMSINTRKDIVKRFISGKKSVLVLCGLFKVGFDCPCIDTVIHYDKCSSTVDFLQKNGRSLRKYPGKIKSCIVLLTDIDNHDTDIIHYRRLLNSMAFYDKRIQQRMKDLKKNYTEGIYSSIELKYDPSIIDSSEYEKMISGIYDKYMDYVSGYKSSVLEKVKILAEYIVEKGVYPTRKEEYRDIKIGSFWDNLKTSFIRPLKKGDIPKLYKDVHSEIIEIFKENDLWDNILNADSITTLEKVKIFVEYIVERGVYPTRKEEYRDIKIGQFWNQLKTSFIRPLKKGDIPKLYKDVHSEIIEMFKENDLWKDMLEIKERVEIIPVLEKVKILVEYIVEKGVYPTFNEEYRDIKIGQFWNQLKTSFIRPLKKGDIPKLYKDVHSEIIEMFKENDLWKDILDKVEIKERVEIIPVLEKVKILVEYIVERGVYPTRKEEYRDIKIGKFWDNLKNYFIRPLKKGDIPKLYKDVQSEIIEIFRENDLWKDMLENV